LNKTNAILWLAAILLGALVPALVFTVFAQELKFLPITLGVTLAHAALLGLPVVLVFRAKHWMRLGPILAGAFLVGTTPGGILALLSMGGTMSASVDGLPTIVNGVPTLVGWKQYGMVVCALGGLGAVGGFIFWLTLKVGSPTADRGEHPKTSVNPRIAVVLAGIAIAASVVVFAIPSITKDRSCHNLFRDGRQSVEPKISFDLDLTMDDWPAVTSFIKGFSAAHGMSFRESSQSQPDVNVLHLNSCTEEGIVIDAMQPVWTGKGYSPALPGRGLPIWVYALREDTNWEKVSRELIAALESRWPGKLRFRDRTGNVVSESEVLPPENGPTGNR
jgi:hypothetical protein